MSDSNLTEKLSESITNVFKKTKVFEKINNIEFYAWSFVTITSIYGIVNLLSNNYHYYRNYNKNIEYNKKLKSNYENIIKNHTILADSILKNNELLQEKINKLEKKIDDILNLPILNIIKKDETVVEDEKFNEEMKEIEEKMKEVEEEIIIEKSLVSESPYNYLIEKDITNISDITDNTNNEIKVIEDEEDEDEVDKEEYKDLVDESYNSLPCVNGNKLTGINRLFNWGYN